MSKAVQSTLFLVAVLAGTGACKPDLNKLTGGSDASGGNGGNQTDGGSAGTGTGGGGTHDEGGSSATGGKGGKGGQTGTDSTGGGKSSGGTSAGGTSAGGTSAGGTSAGGTSAGGTSTGGTTACTLMPFVPGDAPALTYAFDTEGADGTLVGTPTFSTTGRISGAINIGANAYVQLPADVVKTMDYVTVAAWVKTTNNPFGSTLFDFGSAANNHFYLRTGGSTGISYGAQVNGGNVYETNTTYVMPTGVWKHVALSFGDGKFALYVDGLNVKNTSNVLFTPAALGATAGNYVGHTHTDTANFYGLVDDFRIYPRVLNGEEVENLAAPGSDYVHFRFDEPCGNKAYDRSNSARVAELPASGTWTSKGHVGGALTLNGSNQYVKLPDNFLHACNDLTIAMWVQRGSATAVFERLFAFGQDTKTLMTLTPAAGSAPMQFSAKLNGGELRGSDEQQLTSSSAALSPQLGIWGHVAVVLKSSGTSTLYFDGNVAVTNTISVKPSDLGATLINTLGHPVYTSEPYFNGTIDDLRVACRAYTAPEIKLLALVDRDQ